MIAVLADDFTGAAEVAAIGRRYGLAAEVHTQFQPSSGAGLVVVDTLTRSCSREAAAKRVDDTIARLKAGGVDRVHYKKVDSVLRGHVVAELARLMTVGGFGRTVLVPANPSFGQFIRSGRYSIGGLPLSETRFAHDPEHPAATSDVLELLGRHDGLPVTYCEAGLQLPDEGIVITSGATRTDLSALAEQLDDSTLLAGGAEFFDALLQLRLGRPDRPEPGRDLGAPRGHTLLILGSGAQPSRIVLERARTAGVPVVTMPRELHETRCDGQRALASWSAKALECLRAHGHAIVAVDSPGAVGSPMPRVDMIPVWLGDVTSAITRAWSGDLHLYVSGGTTASVVVRRLEWDTLSVVGELGHGVVALRPPSDHQDRSIIAKPGSYPWPQEVMQGLS